MLYQSSGILKYEIIPEYGYRVILETQDDLSDYYRSLIPKYIEIRPQKYNSHISIVRKEIPLILENWGKFDGQEIKFLYNNYINFDNRYFWLNCFSKDLETVRTSLGLELKNHSSDNYLLEGYLKRFHLTIGNKKEK